jgi:type IV pilus assembly protein PilW
MSASIPFERLLRRHRGFGLVEIMIGLVIGLIAVLVIYQVYTVSEGFKRSTTAAGEAQTTGLFSVFTLGLELASAGAGIAGTESAKDLASCLDPGVAMPRNYAESFRPIPVLITDSGNKNLPDSFVVNYSLATAIPASMQLEAPAPAGSTFLVQSPGGIHVGDLLVAVSQPGNPGPIGPCASSKVTAVSAVNNNGFVTVTQTPIFPAGGIDLTDVAKVVNMGPVARTQKIRFWVNNGILYSTPLLDSNGCPFGAAGCPATPVDNPLASNIVNMKIQYGVDTNNDPARDVDAWVDAKAAPWDPVTLSSALNPDINRIKAVRIGIIVQSEQFDQNTQNQTFGDYTWSMFDGALSGTIVAKSNGNWRFRKYETVIPLRNVIWNRF